MKVFLVDDDEFCLTLYKQQLLSLGYSTILTFSNGYDCINNLHEKPDVILLDYGMENFNGFQVLKKIKNINPDIYVIILSGQEDFSIVSDTLHNGAYEFILKGSMDIVNIQSVFRKIANTKSTTRKSLLLSVTNGISNNIVTN